MVACTSLPIVCGGRYHASLASTANVIARRHRTIANKVCIFRRIEESPDIAEVYHVEIWA